MPNKEAGAFAGFFVAVARDALIYRFPDRGSVNPSPFGEEKAA